MKKNNLMIILLLLIILILSAVIAINFLVESPDIPDDEFENESTGECSITISDTEINEGESVSGTITDGQYSECTLYYNLDSEGWVESDTYRTSSSGTAYYSFTPEYAGEYELIAMCDDCNTNKKSLLVTPYDWFENESYEPFVLCESIELPDYGDLGTLCAEGDCEDDLCVCSHYFDYLNKVQMCGCTETFYCGQYCYAYYFTDTCECPPGSTVYLPDRSHYMCVPDGYYCEDGFPVEEVGPFPE